MKKHIKKQIALEKLLHEYSSRKLDPYKTWEENLGPAESWFIKVGDHTLFLNPFNSHWMHYDSIHGSWEKSGVRAGEGLFDVDEKGEIVYQESPNPEVIPALQLDIPVEAEELQPFWEKEKEFLALSIRREEGSLDEGSFREEVHKLRLQDREGVWWQMREEDGGWLRWDGSRWVPAVPWQEK